MKSRLMLLKIIQEMEALDDENKLSYEDGLKDKPNISGELSGEEIVSVLENLDDDDKLSYEDGLKDQPDIGDQVHELTQEEIIDENSETFGVLSGETLETGF